MDDGTAGSARHAELSDSLSLAFLVLLESLSPAERAVFLLREGFGYGYGEIAAALGESAADCRQIFTRARRHADAGRPRFLTSRAGEDGAGGRRLPPPLPPLGVTGGERALSEISESYSKGSEGANDASVHRRRNGRRRTAPRPPADDGRP